MTGYNILRKEMKDGTLKFRCMIRHMEHSKVVYQESKTFTKKAMAKSWGVKKVFEFKQNDFKPPVNSNIIISEMISAYMKNKHIKLGRTKEYVLNLLMDSPIGEMKISELKPRHLVEHCSPRIDSGAGKPTVNHDASYLRSVP